MQLSLIVEAGQEKPLDKLELLIKTLSSNGANEIDSVIGQITGKMVVLEVDSKKGTFTIHGAYKKEEGCIVCSVNFDNIPAGFFGWPVGFNLNEMLSMGVSLVAIVNQ